MPRKTAGQINIENMKEYSDKCKSLYDRIIAYKDAKGIQLSEKMQKLLADYQNAINMENDTLKMNYIEGKQVPTGNDNKRYAVDDAIYAIKKHGNELNESLKNKSYNKDDYRRDQFEQDLAQMLGEEAENLGIYYASNADLLVAENDNVDAKEKSEEAENKYNVTLENNKKIIKEFKADDYLKKLIKDELGDDVVELLESGDVERITENKNFNEVAAIVDGYIATINTDHNFFLLNRNRAYNAAKDVAIGKKNDVMSTYANELHKLDAQHDDVTSHVGEMQEFTKQKFFIDNKERADELKTLENRKNAMITDFEDVFHQNFHDTDILTYVNRKFIPNGKHLYDFKSTARFDQLKAFYQNQIKAMEASMEKSVQDREEASKLGTIEEIDAQIAELEKVSVTKMLLDSSREVSKKREEFAERRRRAEEISVRSLDDNIDNLEGIEKSFATVRENSRRAQEDEVEQVKKVWNTKKSSTLGAVKDAAGALKNIIDENSNSKSAKKNAELVKAYIAKTYENGQLPEDAPSMEAVVTALDKLANIKDVNSMDVESFKDIYKAREVVAVAANFMKAASEKMDGVFDRYDKEHKEELKKLEEDQAGELKDAEAFYKEQITIHGKEAARKNDKKEYDAEVKRLNKEHKKALANNKKAYDAKIAAEIKSRRTAEGLINKFIDNLAAIDEVTKQYKDSYDKIVENDETIDSMKESLLESIDMEEKAYNKELDKEAKGKKDLINKYIENDYKIDKLQRARNTIEEADLNLERIAMKMTITNKVIDLIDNMVEYEAKRTQFDNDLKNELDKVEKGINDNYQAERDALIKERDEKLAAIQKEFDENEEVQRWDRELEKNKASYEYVKGLEEKGDMKSIAKAKDTRDTTREEYVKKNKEYKNKIDATVDILKNSANKDINNLDKAEDKMIDRFIKDGATPFFIRNSSLYNEAKKALLSYQEARKNGNKEEWKKSANDAWEKVNAYVKERDTKKDGKTKTHAYGQIRLDAAKSIQAIFKSKENTFDNLDKKVNEIQGKFIDANKISAKKLMGESQKNVGTVKKVEQKEKNREKISFNEL